MSYEQETSTSIADAIAQEIVRPVNYAAVETDGGLRTAQLITELL